MKTSKARESLSLEAQVKRSELELEYLKYNQDSNHNKTVFQQLVTHASQLAETGLFLLNDKVIIKQLISLALGIFIQKKFKKSGRIKLAPKTKN